MTEKRFGKKSANGACPNTPASLRRSTLEDVFLKLTGRGTEP